MGATVADVMSRDVEFIPGDAPVQEAAVLMGELDVGALPVGTPDTLDGVVTDRDILYRVVAQGLDPRETRVSVVLSRPVVSCAETDPLRTALDLMAAHHVRRLPVRDAGGRVTGWVTLADLSRALLLGGDALQTSLKRLTEEA